MLSTSHSRAQRFHALDRGIRDHLTSRLHRYFNAQARRVVSVYLSEYPQIDQPSLRPPHAEELLPDSELWPVVLPFLLQAILNASELAGALVGLEPLEAEDPRVQRLLNDAHQRIGTVHAATLNAVRTTLAEGVSRGYSPRQIAHGVPLANYSGLANTVGEMYSGRALNIARTEIATVRQLTALERYQEAHVSLAYVVDESECGWTSHADPEVANGTMRTLIEARQHPLSHPGCGRVFLPIR